MKANRARLLAYATGLVKQELLLQNEYLAAENRILPGAPARPAASVGSGAMHACGDRDTTRTQALEMVACVAKPGTILAWYQGLIARKLDGSPSGSYPGRPGFQPRWRNW